MANATYMSRVSCQKGPTRHAYAWQIAPCWQDTLDVCWIWDNARVSTYSVYGWGVSSEPWTSMTVVSQQPTRINICIHAGNQTTHIIQRHNTHISLQTKQHCSETYLWKVCASKTTIKYEVASGCEHIPRLSQPSAAIMNMNRNH